MKQQEVRRRQIQYYSYIFGIIILLMYSHIIGNNGLAYLAIAMETIGIFMVPLGDNTADSFAKMIRFRRKKELYGDVISLKKSILIFQFIIGFLCFGAVFVLADQIAKYVFHLPNAAFIIRVLSPVLLLRTAVSLLTGYFQSFGAQMPILVSCIMRQVLFFALGKTFCVKLYDYGVKVAGLLQNNDFKGMYGAVGLCIAMLISEVVILTALLIYYFLSDPSYDRKRCKDNSRKPAGTRNNILNFLQVNSRGMGIALLKRVLPCIGLVLLSNIDEVGIYYGKYFTICAIPVLLCASRYSVVYARLSMNLKGKDHRIIKDTIISGLQYAWSAGLFATAVVSVMAPQIVSTFFGADGGLNELLQHGAFLVLGVVMMIYFCMVNIVHNRYAAPLIALLCSSVLFVFLSNLMLVKMESSLTAVIYAFEIALCIVTLIFAFFTLNRFRLRPDMIPVFAMPLVCVGLVGLILLLFSKLLSPHIGDAVCFWLGLFVGTILYLVLLGFFRVFNENDVDNLYGKHGKQILSVIFK